MIVSVRAHWLGLLRQSLPTLALLTAVALLVDWFHKVTELRTSTYTLGGIGVLVTVVSIFVGFRMGETYDRWWEARKLWGRLVNASRSFARQVGSVVDLPSELRDRLIRRQIAYVHALRISLAPAERQRWEELEPFLEEDELAKARERANVPAFLVELQAADVSSHLKKTEDRIGWIRIDDTLTELLSIQGGCERIRNTVFPAKVTYFTKLVVWALALLLPFAVLENEQINHLMATVIVVFIGFVFVALQQIGSELKEPFDGKPSSMPLRAICRTIEIDLKQMLGAEDVPPPLTPRRGVLS